MFKGTNHQGGNPVIYISLPFIPCPALCRQLLLLQGKDNESSFLCETPFPRGQSPIICQSGRPELWEPGSEAQGVHASSASLEQAGLAVIDNYLTIDISVPASFFIGCFYIMSDCEKKQ